jgi:hypothetical protein
VSRRELLIFIQPRIVHDMSDLPPNVEDAPGTSPFASEVQNLLVQEKKITAEVPAPNAKRRVDLGRLFRKLFNKDEDEEMLDPAIPAAVQPPVPAR